MYQDQADARGMAWHELAELVGGAQNLLCLASTPLDDFLVSD